MIPPTARPYRAPTVAFVVAALVLAAWSDSSAGTPEEFLKEGIEHDEKLEAKQALNCYLEVEKIQPNNADVLVRIARQYRHLMADASSESEKMKLGSSAMAYGKRAVAADPKSSDAQLSCAISLGKMLPLMGKKDQVSSSKLIKDGAEMALKLDAQNDLAWNILGRWHRNIASMGTVTKALAAMIYEKLPSGSNEEAVNCLQKAIKINPNRLMHYVELGRAYAQMGNYDDAKRYLEKGLSMPCVDKDDPGMKETAREVLASIR